MGRVRGGLVEGLALFEIRRFRATMRPRTFLYL